MLMCCRCPSCIRSAGRLLQ